jgi:DNA-binding NarL/FixJ family response regulator
MLADDHPLVLVTVRGVLEGTDYEVVAEAQSGSQVMPLISRSQPDLLLLDLGMPGVDGLHLLELLGERHPQVTVVVLSGDDNPERIQLALRLGARAYLVKTLAIAELPTLLSEIASGHVYQAPPGWAEQARRHAAADAGLTQKELEILELVAEGLKNPEIAKRLWLSPETVKTHLSSIYRKLGVNSRTAATRAALDRHLLQRSSLAAA